MTNPILTSTRDRSLLCMNCLRSLLLLFLWLSTTLAAQISPHSLSGIGVTISQEGISKLTTSALSLLNADIEPIPIPNLKDTAGTFRVFLSDTLSDTPVGLVECVK